MTRDDVATLMDATFADCLALYQAGQREYAHDEGNALANFDRTAELTGLTPHQVLLVFLQKHFDGVAAYAKGHRSQREDVRGRIRDAIVYLVLFGAMVERDEGERPCSARTRSAAGAIMCCVLDAGHSDDHAFVDEA